MSKQRIIWAGLCLGILGVGCKTRSTSSAGVNATTDVVGKVQKISPIDVSFLLPRAGKLTNPSAKIGAAEGNIMPKDFFTVVHDANFKEGVTKDIFGTLDEIYANTFISGIRYDPCAPQAFVAKSPGEPGTPVESCEGEFRLTAQYWNPKPANGTTNALADAGLHFVYRMEKSEAPQVLTELQDAFHQTENCRVMLNNSPNKPIGPHPCLVGLDSNESRDIDNGILFDGEKMEIFKRVKAVVLKNATASKLKGVAIMVTKKDRPPTGGTRWEWKISVVQNGKLVVVPKMFMVEQSDSSVDNVGFNASGAVGTIVPTSNGVHADVLNVLGDPTKLAADKKELGLTAANNLENPRLTKLPDLKTGERGPDCTGCHVQTMARVRLVKASDFTAVGDLPLNPMHPKSEDEYKSNGNYIVLNFGYHPVRNTNDSHPSINQRTINETYDVVRFLNSK